MANNITHNILIVDDEKMYAEMGERMLTALGYEVTVRSDGADALETFKEAPESFDLVITDQVMPNMSGDELVKEVRAIKPEMPIILCTGFSTEMDEEKAREMGINEFVFKPISINDMARLIRKVLD